MTLQLARGQPIDILVTCRWFCSLLDIITNLNYPWNLPTELIFLPINIFPVAFTSSIFSSNQVRFSPFLLLLLSFLLLSFFLRILVLLLPDDLAPSWQPRQIGGQCCRQCLLVLWLFRSAAISPPTLQGAVQLQALWPGFSCNASHSWCRRHFSACPLHNCRMALWAPVKSSVGTIAQPHRTIVIFHPDK